MPRLERWRRLCDGVLADRLGSGPGAAEGGRLLEAACQPRTARNYINGWERFAAFCREASLCPLPASPETIVRYLGVTRNRGTVAAGSLGTYLSPIAALHALAGYPSPTRDPLVKSAKRGYRREYTAAVGGLRLKRGPLPAAAVSTFLQLWPGAPPDLRHAIAGVALAYTLFNRPGAASHMRACDVFPTARGLEVQIPDFKMGVLKDAERIAYTVPVAPGGWAADRVLPLLREHWRAHRAAGRPAAERLFAPPGRLTPLPLKIVNVWMRDLLRRCRIRAPLGTKWSGHSPRAGAASEAHALGLSDALILQLMGVEDVKTVYRHYIDATWAPTAAAWDWFGRYVPRTRPHLRVDGYPSPPPFPVAPTFPPPGDKTVNWTVPWAARPAAAVSRGRALAL